MTRTTAFILALVVALMIGCGTSDPVSVGDYKGPRDNPDYMQTYKEYGHQGFDIQNPTPEIAEQYCSVCHYIN